MCTKIIPLLLLLQCSFSSQAAEPQAIHILFDINSPQIRFAVERLQKALLDAGKYIVSINPSKPSGISIEIHSSLSKIPPHLKPSTPIRREGYQILPSFENNRIHVVSSEPTGAMYGTLHLAELINTLQDVNEIDEKVSNPRFSFRAIKFNLPWSPYRAGGPTNLHTSVCRDLGFWQKFLDQMAENRFNALTLWNLHPFTYMIRPRNFPEACPFNDAEIEDWKRFWTALFRMAAERGIETYIVNWNIVVSPEFAKTYHVMERNDTSEIVKQYTRECVTQVIDEYPGLTGIGVTLADWMNQMTPKEREDWIADTFVAGMTKASRPVKFIHRSVLAGSPLEMRRVIDNAGLPDPVWVEIKFNWSHGHSTPRLAITHDYNTGEIDERFWNPTPENYKIAWMIRNEDFFILRWGEPDFIREHIRMNGNPYVDGYFVGSEGYIPAMDYSHILHPHQTWQYGFEKQWFFYTTWGRLLYDPSISDEVFIAKLKERYPAEVGKNLFDAIRLASRMPLRLASFHAATWDYTLYSEGFIAPARSRGYGDTISPFISIMEFIDHETLDPTWMNIPAYVSLIVENQPIPEDKKTPAQLADESERDANEALRLCGGIRPFLTEFTGALECEVLDAEAWSYLGLYFAEKLRGGIALETFRRTGNQSHQATAIQHLESAVTYWDRLLDITSRHYRDTPHVYEEMKLWERDVSARKSTGVFSWRHLREQVLFDIELAKSVKPD